MLAAVGFMVAVVRGQPMESGRVDVGMAAVKVTVGCCQKASHGVMGNINANKSSLLAVAIILTRSSERRVRIHFSFIRTDWIGEGLKSSDAITKIVTKRS
jgi:hypothetical protein